MCTKLLVVYLYKANRFVKNSKLYGIFTVSLNFKLCRLSLGFASGSRGFCVGSVYYTVCRFYVGYLLAFSVVFSFFASSFHGLPCSNLVSWSQQGRSFQSLSHHLNQLKILLRSQPKLFPIKEFFHPHPNPRDPIPIPYCIQSKCLLSNFPPTPR